MLSKKGIQRRSHSRNHGNRPKNKRRSGKDPYMTHLKHVRQSSDNLIEDMVELDPRNQPYRDESRKPEMAYHEDDEELIGLDRDDLW